MGGEGVVAKTNKILKEMLTDELACQLNFCGGHNKEAFNKLKLKVIIVGKYLFFTQNIYQQSYELDIKRLFCIKKLYYTIAKIINIYLDDQLTDILSHSKLGPQVKI